MKPPIPSPKWQNFVLEDWRNFVPGWAITWIEESYSSPAQTICLLGLICHPSLFWAAAFVTAQLCHPWVISWGDVHSSLKHLEEVYSLLKKEDYLLRPVDNLTYTAIEKFLDKSLYQTVFEQLKGPIKTNVDNDPFYKYVSQEPVRIFIAEGKYGKLLPEPKAYTNLVGSSLILLHYPLDRMDAVDRFFLLHELEHVNPEGSKQLSALQSRPLFLCFSIPLLFFLTSVWWHWLIIAIYIWKNLVANTKGLGKREVIADNGALRKLSSIEEKKEVLEFLIELSISNLQSIGDVQIINKAIGWGDEPSRPQWEDLVERMELVIELKAQNKLNYSIVTWLDRLRFFRSYEQNLKEELPLPSLGWMSFEDRRYALLFNLFFVYLGVITTSPPIIPFILMFVFVVFDTFYAIVCRAKIMFVNDYIDKYIEKQVVES
jgi:hypothetical protein